MKKVAINEKVALLEDELKTCRSRMDGFGKELKILLAEINVISEWIMERFGVELIDKTSFLFKHIHDYDEVEALSANISSLSASNQKIKKETGVVTSTAINSKSKRTAAAKKGNYNENVDSDVDFQVPSPEVLFMEGSDSEDGVKKEIKKRKRGRPRKHPLPTKKSNKKEIGAIEEGDESTSVSEKVPKRGRPKKQLQAGKTPKEPPIPSQCDTCGKILKDAGSLRQHKLIHKNVRPFPCEDCGKCFRRKFHLKTHRLIHAGVKKHQCGYCGKLFLLPKDLIAHERIHTGERPFSCPTCPKSFNLKSHLVMHIRTHTGEKPYKCPICEKSFSQSNSLRVHKKVHQRQRSNAAAKSQLQLNQQQQQHSTNSNKLEETSDHSDVSQTQSQQQLHPQRDVSSSLPGPSSEMSSSLRAPTAGATMRDMTFDLVPMALTHHHHQHQQHQQQQQSFRSSSLAPQPHQHSQHQTMKNMNDDQPLRLAVDMQGNNSLSLQNQNQNHSNHNINLQGMRGVPTSDSNITGIGGMNMRPLAQASHHHSSIGQERNSPNQGQSGNGNVQPPSHSFMGPSISGPYNPYYNC